MIRRRRIRRQVGNGFYRIENINSRRMDGFGDGDYVRLRDEFGNVWRGQAEVQDDDSVRYRFRDEKGRTISGASDRYGITLRDERGMTWRGYVY
jgi:hypothetical protein